MKLPGLQKGKYRANWWDTTAGKTLDSSDIEVKGGKDDIVLTMPPITRDAALYIIKAGTEKGMVAKNRGRGGSSTQQSPVGSGGAQTNLPAAQLGR